MREPDEQDRLLAAVVRDTIRILTCGAVCFVLLEAYIATLAAVPDAARLPLTTAGRLRTMPIRIAYAAFLLGVMVWINGVRVWLLFDDNAQRHGRVLFFALMRSIPLLAWFVLAAVILPAAVYILAVSGVFLEVVKAAVWTVVYVGATLLIAGASESAFTNY